MINWLLSSVPVWFWIGLAIFAAAILFRLLGWRGSAAFLAAALPFVAYAWGKRDERDRTIERERAKAERLKRFKQQADALTEDELRKELQRWIVDD